ncbi:MAG: glycosyltransferase family 2 protein [Actinomycetales bacterium]
MEPPALELVQRELGPPPLVTTVVMTRNRRTEAMECVRRNQPPLILVDNGSTDGTAEAVQRLDRPDVQVVALPANIGAAARNIGVRLAQTPLVAFADDDSWWEADALDRAAAAFAAHPRLGLLAARLLVGADQATDPVAAQMAAAPLGRHADLPGVDILGFLACAAVVRRAAFLATGGFDDVVFFPGEEERVALDLAALGWGMAYVDEVVAHHLPSQRRESGSDRSGLIVRNGILTAVMRRPWPVALRRAARAARSGPEGQRALLAAARRLPAALRARRRLPASVERQAAALETGQPRPGPLQSTAR